MRKPLYPSTFAVQPLAFVISLALLGGLPSSVLAQSSDVAEQHQLLDFDVPAGPLSERLLQISRSAGLVITVDAALVNGKAAPAVRGRMSAEQALQRALTGSGLVLTQGAAGYTLHPAQDAGVLPAIRVNASELGSTTEGTGSYTTGSLSTATKLPLSIRETPQSVTVITRDRMDDQGLITTSDVLKNTPGITTTASTAYRESYHARGFVVDNYLFDGLPISTNNWRRGMFLNDLAMYDRVEVVRGAAGLAQGAGTPSAAINFVRKRPTQEFQASVQGEVGRWNHLATTGDISGPLSQEGSLRGRAVVRWHDSDSFMDVVTENRQLIYLIGEADITQNTLLTVGVSQQKNDNTTNYGGLPTAADGSDLKLPRSTFLGNSWNYWDDDTMSLFASLEHRFNNGWKVHFGINQFQGEQHLASGGVTLSETGTWDQLGLKADVDNDRVSYDLYTQGPLNLFGREHDLIIGINKRTADEKGKTAGYWPGPIVATDIDIYSKAHYNFPMPDFVVDYHSNSHEEQYGGYTTLRVNVTDPLKLILGLRIDTYKFDFADSYWVWDWDNQVRTDWEPWSYAYDYDNHLTKYAGLIYDLSKHYSVYVSYTDIFKAQNNRTPANEFIKPIVGENYEAGIKAEYFDGALNINAAVFQVDEGNRAMAVGPCPFNENTTCYEPTGLVRSEGYDLEIQGALTENWQIGGGYTHVKTNVKKDSNPSRVGLGLNTQMPTDQFKVSTVYRFTNKWRIGGNLRWQDDVYYQWTGGNYRTEQGAYTIADVMLGYSHNEHLDIQLNISNLFDEVYYSSINAQPVIWGGNTVYGEPRNATLTARYKF